MHEPVLLQEVIAAMNPTSGERYLDATAGYGGHAREILAHTHNFSESVLVDRDKAAVDHLMAEFATTRVKIVRNDFYSAAEDLVAAGQQFDLILADLGVSSLHLDKASRGFSFAAIGPLDMRMDQRQTLTAETVVNEWSAESLEQILRNYGEEPKARRIAKAIVAHRPIATTSELANIVARTTGRWTGKHPATRTFQAIRIAVNDELRLLERVMPLWVAILRPGGRLGIISFHSLEDRLVKRFFLEHGGDRFDASLSIVTKQPVVAGSQEIAINPRSRSAKLRVAAKI
ncbi:16S rRNA (cytosine(1402)-N(4))-methyltransferase RsmH [Candidatus Saccharibacteria bacterium]|nr:16S rRNA (cytosine(1402)-N(4))-methyltransferase RsmH [Candidatus Saccharibacteria bacterium]HPD99143.1 16S rRNA (cytosine(1402)-N(4))-methyltransferase RsmH [Candidatus Saccharibacteria bacterium]